MPDLFSRSMHIPRTMNSLLLAAVPKFLYGHGRTRVNVLLLRPSFSKIEFPRCYRDVRIGMLILFELSSYGQSYVKNDDKSDEIGPEKFHVDKLVNMFRVQNIERSFVLGFFSLSEESFLVKSRSNSMVCFPEIVGAIE